MFTLKHKKIHILIYCPVKIPAIHYGGIERVIWDLGKALHQQGYQITYLVKSGSYCDFAKVIHYNPSVDINQQIPDDVDLVHCHDIVHPKPQKPYLVTIHVNPGYKNTLDQQCVFISKNHAERHQSNAFVYNGLDWDNYPKPNFNSKRAYFHFLANAAWKVKNVKGAMEITKQANEKLEVLGGYRFNFKMGWRFTFDTHVRFRGMVNNVEKAKYIQQSKGLIFPVLWDEPFGLAIIESMYFGCPVFATPYGAIPELVNEETGFLSTSVDDLAYAIKKSSDFDSIKIHHRAKDLFSANFMANQYLKYYERVLNGEALNENVPTLKEEVKSKYLPFDYSSKNSNNSPK
jgi:glycosyltransferase involved in cell wall biosynthesis